MPHQELLSLKSKLSNCKKNNMHTDGYFWIGSSHLVNQDYVNVGEKHIIVSDGCSGSPNTDWGSRFISKAAERSLSYFPSEAFSFAVINEATKMRLAAGLPEMCLDATLLVAAEINGKVIAKAFGDGAMAFIREDNSIEVHSMEYIKEAPFYVNYLNNKERMDGFAKVFGFGQKLTKFTLKNKVVSNLTVSEHESREFYTVEVPDDVKIVLLMSDGVRTFFKRTPTGQEYIELCDVLVNLFDFKNYYGVFVERRCKKFSKVEMQKLEWVNIDDVAIAGMFIK